MDDGPRIIVKQRGMPDAGEFTPPDVQVRHTTEERIMPVVQLAFSPLHKAAFGIATGTACALLLMVITVAWLLFPRVSSFPLHLLAQYFRGYDTTWPGVAVGGLWAFATGFVAGWFIAFCRNLALAISAFTLRTRAELSETREFLDHI